MQTYKLVVKHAGSSLVSNLRSVETFTEGYALSDEFLASWRDIQVDRDSGWKVVEGLFQRDVTTLPGEDEAPFLFRFTIK